MTPQKLAIDLFCGLGGWAEGFLAEGWTVIGFDIERHDYGTGGYPGHLALQDVLTLHGSQFARAGIIVASPPCQNYSYLAMPWSRSKDPNNSKSAKDLRRKWETEGPDNRLFDACFRLQREAIAAAGRHIPLVVENVRGAQPWVGRAAWNYGSFYLWGDVPALMPTARQIKNSGGSWFAQRDNKPLDRCDPRDMRKGDDGTFAPLECKGGQNHPGKALDGIKQGGNWWHDPNSHTRRFSSRSVARKAASAHIAKIPFVLAQHIARVYA